MSSVFYQQVAMQNVCAPEINTLLTTVPLCHGNTVISSEKVTDSVTGSKAHKILQYGSRHTIQNTGWTTRLSCDPSQRKNPVPTGQKSPVATMSGKGFKPLIPRLPFLTINQPTVLKLQSSAPASSAAVSTVTSGTVLQTVLAQPHASANAVPSSSSSALNHAVLTMPPGKPATVCFVPVSSVICGPPSGLQMMKNLGSFAVTQAPTSFIQTGSLNLGSLFAQSSVANGSSKTVVTNTEVKTLSSSSVQSAKEMVTCSSNGQASSVRMLTMKVHIENGNITEVIEVAQKQGKPPVTPGVLAVHLDANVLTSAVGSGTAVASRTSVDHVDTNGAQFGYHNLHDGTRIRIARDTNGQRHAPVFLLPDNNGLCPFEEPTVELTTSSSTASQLVPEEADVSEVGTVFTYEPVYVSEHTLMPVPRKEMRSPDSTVNSSENESHYYYRCYLCSYISDDHTKVCKHWVNVHLSELPYRCPYCGRTFFTSTKAQVHVQCQHQRKEWELTTVALQQSSYFANVLSYQFGKNDIDEGNDSDEEEAPPIVLEHCQRSLQRRNFGCRKCSFKTCSLVELRHHVKFVHRHGNFMVSDITRRQQTQVTNEQSPGTIHLLQADIAWSNISEQLMVGGVRWYQCRWCAFRVKDASVMSLHALKEHHWPAAVLCPSCSCNIQLTDEDRKSMNVICSSCKSRILLDLVYVCNICAFKTLGKGSMCKHIKYNHTKCRPYACVYCNYVAVEHSQVKMHITDHHPGQSVIVKERTEANDQFRHILEKLFQKLVSVQTGETVGLQLSEDSSGADADGGRPVLSGDVDSPFFTCEACKLETSSLEQLISHQHHMHKTLLAANAAMVPVVHVKQSIEIASTPGECFKCKICGYGCLDRSCMSRHVKYMHITARPHSCMYCSYINVEKTKVRLHVMAHHPEREKIVRTDHRILEEMSWQAKHFYVRIDRKGQVIDEFGSLTNNNSCDPAGRPSGAASPSSSDSDLGEDISTSQQPDNNSNDDDARDNDVDSGFAKKQEGVVDDDDDVDINFYPRRNRVDSASANSIVTLDHNYFRISTPDDHSAAVTADSHNAVIKEEPLDFEYEDRIIHHDSNAAPEVKAEVNSLDSFEMSDSDSYDFSDSEKSDDLDPFDGEPSSDSEPYSDNDEPVRKKIKVAFGVDPAEEGSTTMGSLFIDPEVWEDPKMHMTPVVELEDVLEIILAWQQNIGETDYIL